MRCESESDFLLLCKSKRKVDLVMHQDGISGKESFAKTSFLRYIGYLNFIKDLTKHGLLQIQALVPPLNFLNY